MSNFQIVVLGMCVALLLIGIGVFASFGGFLGGGGVGRVVIWGTVDSDAMHNFLDTLRVQDKSFENVSYIEKEADAYEAELLNAMANGTAPDLFLFSNHEMGSFDDKVLLVPYSSFSQSSYLSSFVDEGELFLTREGALALPLMIDPLVMYFNRDLFSGAGIASAPRFWNDFLTLSPKITSLDSGSNVKRSAVALGEWRNVAHAKEILSALFMQAGDYIVVWGENGPVVVLGSTPPNYPNNPAESALRFYTEFANPSKTSYSWNRSLPRSTDAFIAGDLAAYFGFASEYAELSARNPNLRFSVATLPQIEGNATRVTFGILTGLAVPRSAANPAGALEIAKRMSSRDASAIFSNITGLPPARRDLAANTEDNAAMEVFVQSAIISRGWLDPNAEATNGIFQVMIESVVSGKNQSGQAVLNASQELSRLIPRE